MKITHDTTTFTLTGKDWGSSYPLSELADWIAFYKDQRQRFPKSGTNYDATINALTALAEQIGSATT